MKICIILFKHSKLFFKQHALIVLGIQRVSRHRPHFGPSAATKDKDVNQGTPNAFYYLRNKNTNENMIGMTIRMTSLFQSYHNNSILLTFFLERHILLSKYKESVSHNCYRNPITTKASCESNKHLSSAHLM